MPPDLTVYHTNDMHNRGGVLDLLHRMRRAEPHLLLDCGDAIRGSNTVFHWSEPILSRMQRTGYHAQTMGNREQHYLRFVQKLRAHERGFPILAANMVDLHNPHHNLWQSHVELKVGELKVALVGATPPQYPLNSRLEKTTGLRFLPAEDVIPPLVEELRPRCDVLIFMSHLGLAMDRVLAPRLTGVDLVVGGHSHDLLPVPERAANTWLVQVGCYGRYLGQAELYLNPLRVEYKLLETE